MNGAFVSNRTRSTLVPGTLRLPVFADADPSKIEVIDRCFDRVFDGDDSGIDCGGSCSDCPNRGTCRTGADCQSGSCTGGLCGAPTCSDGILDGFEAGADCGGPCTACA